jgi:hypothetical protein
VDVLQVVFAGATNDDPVRHRPEATGML